MESNLNISNMSELDNILNAERVLNKNSTWNKLDKSSKLQKFKEYCEDSNHIDKKDLFETLSEGLETGKLQKMKDVTYDRENGKIIDIPMLSHVNGKYHIKTEKRISTSKSLPVKSKLKNTKKKKYKIDNKE